MAKKDNKPVKKTEANPAPIELENKPEVSEAKAETKTETKAEEPKQENTPAQQPAAVIKKDRGSDLFWYEDQERGLGYYRREDDPDGVIRDPNRGVIAEPTHESCVIIDQEKYLAFMAMYQEMKEAEGDLREVALSSYQPDPKTHLVLDAEKILDRFGPAGERWLFECWMISGRKGRAPKKGKVAVEWKHLYNDLGCNQFVHPALYTTYIVSIPHPAELSWAIWKSYPDSKIPLAANPYIADAVMRKLEDEVDQRVMQNVCRNPKADPMFLLSLWEDKPSRRLFADWVIDNPNCPQKILNEAVSELTVAPHVREKARLNAAARERKLVVEELNKEKSRLLKKKDKGEDVGAELQAIEEKLNAAEEKKALDESDVLWKNMTQAARLNSNVNETIVFL